MNLKVPAAVTTGLVIVVAGIALVLSTQTKKTRPHKLVEPAVAQVDVPFSKNSIWNTPVAANAQMDPNSATYVSEFGAQFQKHFGHVGINTYQYTPPIYEVGADVAPSKVAWNDCQNKGTPNLQFLDQVASVPIPANAKPSNGTDQEMVIWQKSTDTMWDLWEAKNDSGQWSACWGGRMTNASTSNGIYPYPFGTTASGMSLLAGLVRPEELKNKKIDHALTVGIVDVAAKRFVSPANRTDGSDASATAIPEGQRFRLDPAVNVDSLKLSDAGKTIARAMQTYGFFVRDHSGAVNFYAENSSTAGDYNALFNGQPESAVLKNIPWDHLQALAPSN